MTQGKPQSFLDGQASVSGELAAVRLTGAKTEDDFPVMAQGPDGTVWLAYVAYTAGTPILMDRILQGGFEALEPKGNGDQIRLMRFDGKQWHAPINATEGKLDLWRPTISVDGQGVVWLVWRNRSTATGRFSRAATRRAMAPRQASGPRLSA